MVEFADLLQTLVKGFIGGAASFFIQRLLEAGKKELDEYQALPRESVDIEKEEILFDFVDVSELILKEIKEGEGQIISKSFIVIQSRANVFVFPIYLKIARLTSKEKKPKGPST